MCAQAADRIALKYPYVPPACQSTKSAVPPIFFRPSGARARPRPRQLPWNERHAARLRMTSPNKANWP